MSDLFELSPGIVRGAYVAKGATISACGRYRYRLWREWRGYGSTATWDWWTEDDDVTPALDGAGEQLGEPKSVVFVMLNPSTADSEDDDRTIRRCVSFAQAWGYDRVEVVNLFAWRATDPKEVLAMTARGDPIGPDNQHHVEMAIDDAGLVVCAWGAHGGHMRHDQAVIGWIEGAGGVMHALRLTKDGHPSHPLYLPKALTPFRWSG